jgi:hypothetical protein
MKSSRSISPGWVGAISRALIFLMQSLNFLDKVPYSILIVAAIFMLLAPFRPMPHVVEKLIMLKNGTLTKPIDVFDLFYHLIPTFILILKILRNFKK